MKCRICGEDFPSKYYFSAPNICNNCFQKCREKKSDSDHMQCPVCYKKLIEKRISGITIDQCELCHGIWFDADELEAFCIVSGLDHKSAHSILDNVKYSQSAEKLACPRCKNHNLENAQAHQISLLQCKKCFGLFLKYETIQSILQKSHISKGSKFQIDEDMVGFGAVLFEFISDIFLE